MRPWGAIKGADEGEVGKREVEGWVVSSLGG